MKKILFLIVAGLAGLGAMMTSCGGGQHYTPEQLDSIARAVGPDTLLCGVKDAKYAVVARQGICEPNSVMLLIESYDGKVYTTNVVKTGDTWTNVISGCDNYVNALNGMEWQVLSDSVFTREAKAVELVDKTLAEISAESNSVFEEELNSLNEIARAVYSGKWDGYTSGQLQEKMSHGQKAFYSWEYSTEGDTRLAGVSLIPEDLVLGTFKINFQLCTEGPEGKYYQTETGVVRFERVDGQFMMVSSTNVHVAPEAP